MVKPTLSDAPTPPSTARPDTFQDDMDASLQFMADLPGEMNPALDYVEWAMTEAGLSAEAAATAIVTIEASAAAVLAVANAQAYDPAVFYSFPGCAIDDDGYTYRCMGVNVINAKPSANAAPGGLWKNLSISGAAGNVMVDESAIGDKKTLVYDLATGKLKYSLPALAALSDVPAATAGKLLKRKADDTGFEWASVTLADTDVPAPVAGKFLKRKADDTGYEWYDMITGSAIDQISLDIQKPYTDTTSFYTIMETDGYVDMVAYKESFKTWFTTANNADYIDPAQSQNIFDNVMRSQKALAVLFSIGEGHDWLIAHLFNAAHQAYIKTAITALALGRDVTFHSTATPTAWSEYAIPLTQNSGSYAFVKNMTAYAATGGTTAYLKAKLNGNALIEVPQISAYGSTNSVTYTPEQYGTTMAAGSTASALLYVSNTGYTYSFDVTISVLDRPDSFLGTVISDYPADCTTWACKVSYDLGLPITDPGSFSSRIANDTTGNLVEYLSAFGTLIADPLFSATMTPGNNIHNNIFNTLGVSNAVLHNAGIVDYIHSHSTDATIGAYIEAAISGAYVSIATVVASATSTSPVTADIPAGALGYISNIKTLGAIYYEATHSVYDGVAGSGSALYTVTSVVNSLYNTNYTFSTSPFKGNTARSVLSASTQPTSMQVYTTFSYIL